MFSSKINSKKIYKISTEQTVLEGKMQNFLRAIGEKFPDWIFGLCNAFVLLKIRADLIGEETKNLQRLYFLQTVEPDVFSKMIELFKLYQSKYHELINQNKEKLINKISPFEEKFKAVRKQTADCKGRYFRKKLAFSQIELNQYEEEIRNIREVHYYALEKAAINSSTGENKENQELLAMAKELYFYIHNLFGVQNPSVDYNLRVNNKTVVQEDLINLLKIFPADDFHKKTSYEEKALSSEANLPIKFVTSIGFCFTKDELVQTLDEMICHEDIVLLSCCNHQMYLKKIDNSYELFDTESGAGALLLKFKSSQDLVEGMAKLYKSFTKNKMRNLSAEFYIFEKFENQSKRISAKNFLEKMLKQRGKNIKIDLSDSTKMTALWVTAKSGNNDNVLKLLEHHANPNIPRKRDHLTPINVAAIFGYVDIVKSLVESKADLTIADVEGWTPLLNAAYYGHAEMINIFNSQKINLNEVVKVKRKISDQGSYPPFKGNVLNTTAACVAAMNGHADVINKLAQCGADLNFPGNKGGSTPAHYAVEQGHREVIKVLALQDVDFTQKNRKHISPVKLALSKKKWEMVAYMMMSNQTIANLSEAEKKQITICRDEINKDYEKITGKTLPNFAKRKYGEFFPREKDYHQIAEFKKTESSESHAKRIRI